MGPQGDATSIFHPTKSVPSDSQLFFAKVLRSAPEDEIKALFTQFGAVHSINLFRAFQGAPTSKVGVGPSRRVGVGLK